MSIFHYKTKEKQPMVIPLTWQQVFLEGKTVKTLTRNELLEIFQNIGYPRKSHMDGAIQSLIEIEIIYTRFDKGEDLK